MGIFDGCLLACDIDGTLIYDKLLPERNIKKIEDFVRQGGKFALSTGRTTQAVSDVTSKINCIAPSVFSNGCVIYDFENKKSVKEKLLSKRDIEMVNEVVNSVGVGVEMHDSDIVYVPKRSTMTDLHQQYESMQAKFVDMQTASSKDINKIIYFLETEEQRKAVSNIAQHYKDTCAFYNTGIAINGVWQSYIEQMPFGVSKAAGLKELCGILGIKAGGFFAIGDYYNDVEMLKCADISAAPEEAPESVKDAALVVVGPAADGAVADFIEYLEENVANGQ